MKPLLVLAAMLTMTTAMGCSDDDAAITNECGTFFEEDLENSDGVFPQDPETPSLVAACENLCAAMEGEAACGGALDACVDACRLESCDVCPGRLQPLVECRTTAIDGSACGCGAAGPDCDVPSECADEESALSACGG